jgi:hypothetical protein
MDNINFFTHQLLKVASLPFLIFSALLFKDLFHPLQVAFLRIIFKKCSKGTCYVFNF